VCYCMETQKKTQEEKFNSFKHLGAVLFSNHLHSISKNGKYCLLRSFDTQSGKFIFRIINLGKIVSSISEKERFLHMGDLFLDLRCSYYLPDESIVLGEFFSKEYYPNFDDNRLKSYGFCEHTKNRSTKHGKYHVSIKGKRTKSKFCIEDATRNTIVFDRKKEPEEDIISWAVTKDFEKMLLGVEDVSKHYAYSYIEIYRTSKNFFWDNTQKKRNNKLKRRLLKSSKLADIICKTVV